MAIDDDLFLIMPDEGDFRYSVYKIEDSRAVVHSETISSLGDPLLRLEKSLYPEDMSFASIGSQIYMSGGSFRIPDNYRASNQVFVYDTRTSTIAEGPNMNFGKSAHHLFSVGSTLFALSNLMYEFADELGHLNPQPSFEVCDTSNMENGWFNLPMPNLKTTTLSNVYPVSAVCAVFVEGYSSCVVFISVEDAGSYAFNLDNCTWSYMGDDVLPFSGVARTTPHDPFVCCAHSMDKLCSFRFSNEIGAFKAEEIKINDSDQLFPLEPELMRCRALDPVLSSNGRVYLIATGVDRAINGARYIKVSALGQVLKSSSKRRKEMNVIEQDDSEMSVRWRLCYHGGPVCDELIHVAEAFAM